MAQDSLGNVSCSIKDAVASIVLDNQGQRNALTYDMCQRLITIFTELKQQELKAIVLSGAGDHFGAGIAIDQMDRVLFDAVGEQGPVNHFDLLDDVITSCPIPTIAVVRGNCFGGAWQLATACDIQLASENVRLAITPAKIGLVYPRRGLERLAATVGQSRARYLLFSGAELDAQSINSWGLFTHVLPEEQLEERTEKLLAQLRSNSPFALQETKLVLTAVAEYQGSELTEYWEKLWERTATHPQLAEGRAAFLEHRPARFDDC